jgi:hypothetical protein
MVSVGIDQHRQQLTVQVRGDQREVVLRRQVSTPWDKVREFLDDLDGQGAPTAGDFAIVEVCGFNDWLLQHLRRSDAAAGIDYQGGEPGRAVPAGPSRAASAAGRCLDARVVQTHPSPSPEQDRPGGCDASAGHDHLAPRCPTVVIPGRNPA